MNKEIKKIFLILGLYALSGGMYYNFQELWMASNGLSLKTISIILSLGALLSVSVIFLSSNLITQNRLKKFACTLFLIKFITLILLFILNFTGLNVLIKFLILLDYVVDVEIYASIYPMITMITKNDKLYAIRGLIYSWAYYIGVLIAGLTLGKLFNFNSYCLIAGILMLISYIVLRKTNLEANNQKKEYNNYLKLVMKKIKQNKTIKCYLSFLLLGQIAYYSVFGLLATLLTNILKFTPQNISNFNLILGILSAFVGSLILSKFTFKNDYLNITIKYGGRLLLFILASVINNNLAILIALVYAKIMSDSYTHITDAPYINSFTDKEQLAFCNLREMISYLGRSIGIFICGILFKFGIRYIFIFSSLFIVCQIVFAYYAIYLRNIKKVVKQ